jgi:hypothetical protein
MRAAVSVVLDDGTVMEGVAELTKVPSRVSKAVAFETKPGGVGAVPPMDFDGGPRPFIKKYGVGLSGPEKLILLVAYFAKGKTQAPVTRTTVVDQWKRMTSIMGGKYNGAYDTRARDTNYLLSPKPGVFELRLGWEKILK